ncbi:CoA-transferase family III [Biscogniauxia sp. FL1348]|nr:CoA-transferase family III [Biscogniauxia sp. FL1348]
MVGDPPLKGLIVLEFAGLAPGPFAGMLLADAGAHVLRIDRAPSGSSSAAEATPDMLARRKRSIAVDLKTAAGASLIRRLAAAGADVLIDPYRPGVLEGLGLGPEALRARAPRLIYARLAGFRRDGRYAAMAGHDINYLAVSGVLALLGRAGQPPHAPWNLIADFAGGGAALVHGILLALLARHRDPHGRGQVVEANMVDGSSYVASFARVASLRSPAPLGGRPRGENLLDGGAPFYDTYATRDGGYMAVGALEPRFYAQLVRRLGLAGRGYGEDDEAQRHDRARWPAMRRAFADAFASRTRAEWEAVFDGSDACCTPVLEYAELERARADQRPLVGLRDTPCLAVGEDPGDPSVRGQGEGVPGGGYAPSVLYPGQGGEEALRDWFGWARGRDYDVEGGGGLVAKETAKL